MKPSKRNQERDKAKAVKFARGKQLSKYELKGGSYKYEFRETRKGRYND
jgi:hypothetical protein